MKNLSILGSTGSIGVSTLEIVASFPELYRVSSLVAGKNITLLEKQIRRFRPDVVSVSSEVDAARLRKATADCGVEVLSGAEGMVHCATLSHLNMVVSAIVGAAGLVPTLAAIEAGHDIALANKETLVVAGDIVMEAAKRNEVSILPVDSEHSAVFQSLLGHRKSDVRRLILTASGGPFLHHSVEQLASVEVSDALAHPNWSMGRKISIDSASMMNKGLEVIEARWLFDLPVDGIDVQVHPQSIVHSMVEYRDGAIMAQMGLPEMKTPIAYALSFPDRLPLKVPPLDLCSLSGLTFARPDEQKFPCLGLAYEAIRAGGTAPAVLNAANEVAVEAFLNGEISFVQIPYVIDSVLSELGAGPLSSLDHALAADWEGREAAHRIVRSFS